MLRSASFDRVCFAGTHLQSILPNAASHVQAFITLIDGLGPSELHPAQVPGTSCLAYRLCARASR